MDVGIGGFTEMDFDRAVEATRTSLRDRGFEILHEIDLTEMFRRADGTEIERAVVLGASNAVQAARGYAINKDIALLMPWNVVVRESGGGCVVEAQNPSLMPRVVSGGLQDIADEVAAELRSMLADLTG